MHPDLDNAIVRAAPWPTRDLDVARLRRDARRMRFAAAAGYALLIAIVGASAFGGYRFISSKTSDRSTLAKPSYPLPTPAGGERVRLDPDGHPPGKGELDGHRRLVLAAETLRGRKFGEWNGAGFRFSAWGDANSHCLDSDIGENRAPWICSRSGSGKTIGHLAGRAYIPSQTTNLVLLQGRLSDQVAYLDIVLPDTRRIRVGVIVPPDWFVPPGRYFYLFTPVRETIVRGRITARDAQGRVLQTEPLLHSSSLCRMKLHRPRRVEVRRCRP